MMTFYLTYSVCDIHQFEYENGVYHPIFFESYNYQFYIIKTINNVTKTSWYVAKFTNTSL